MATLKVVRAGGARRTTGPKPPPPPPLPRLAAIRMHGAEALRAPKAAAERGGPTLGAVLLLCGSVVAGAAFLGGSMLDVREAFARYADGLAADAGFAVRHVEVAGVEGARRDEVAEVAMAERRRSLFSADPHAVRTRVQSLDWVAEARVRRLWPSGVKIEVERRRAIARWRMDGEITVIDAAGERVHGAKPEDYAFLPLISGAGAGPAAAPVLAAIDADPELRRRFAALARIGDRRFDLALHGGLVLQLPEGRPVEAIGRIAALQRNHALLDRPFATLDLRLPDRVVARPRPPAAADA